MTLSRVTPPKGVSLFAQKKRHNGLVSSEHAGVGFLDVSPLRQTRHSTLATRTVTCRRGHAPRVFRDGTVIAISIFVASCFFCFFYTLQNLKEMLRSEVLQQQFARRKPDGPAGVFVHLRKSTTPESGNASDARDGGVTVT